MRQTAYHDAILRGAGALTPGDVLGAASSEIKISSSSETLELAAAAGWSFPVVAF